MVIELLQEIGPAGPALARDAEMNQMATEIAAAILRMSGHLGFIVINRFFHGGFVTSRSSGWKEGFLPNLPNSISHWDQYCNR
jgi:hypothetical protein